MRTGLLSIAAFGAALACAALQPAQADDSAVAALATYTGADRTERLLEGARKEGGLTLYSSATTQDMNEMIRAFEKKYSLKVKFWRGDSESILQRAVTEARGRHDEADIFETGGSTLEPLYREHLLQPVKSPVLADISSKAQFPHGAWVGTRFQIQTLAYNTNVVKPSDLPKTWNDLLDPRWKGKLGIELDDAGWFSVIVTALGEEQGLKLMRDIAARNGVSVRKGHTLLANLTASGEIALSLGIYKYKVAQMKRAGAPIELWDLPPVAVHAVGEGLSVHAPHPNAALLFFDFLLTDAQPIYIQQDNQPTNIRVMPEPEHAVYIDFGKALDESEKWTKLFKETFMVRR